MDDVTVFHATLHGEQSPGISLNFAEKVKIAEPATRLDICWPGVPYGYDAGRLRRLAMWPI